MSKNSFFRTVMVPKECHLLRDLTVRPEADLANRSKEREGSSMAFVKNKNLFLQDLQVTSQVQSSKKLYFEVIVIDMYIETYQWIPRAFSNIFERLTVPCHMTQATLETNQR